MFLAGEKPITAPALNWVLAVKKFDIKHVGMAKKKNSPARLKSTSTARPSATNFPRARTVSDEQSLSFLLIQLDLIAFFREWI